MQEAMEWELEGTSIPSPSEVMSVCRELAPELCKKLDSLSAFQDYAWTEKALKEIRVHPRQEMFARLWCNPPPRLKYRTTLSAASFALHIDPTLPEYEMHLVYKDGTYKIVKLD